MIERFVVKVTRDDGSVTYKGPLGIERAERERDAWLECDRQAECIPVAEADEYRAWCRWLAANKHDIPRYGLRFCPEKVRS